jgi:RHS repeat-associated protein
VSESDRSHFLSRRFGERASVLVKCTALVVTVALLAGTAGSGNGLYLSARQKHHAQPAPEQRWGSAAGQGHVVGKSGNRTVPKTLRNKYPLRSAVATPMRASNKASVAAPPSKQVKGFDQKTSRELSGRRGAHERVFANTDGTETTEFSAAPVNYRRSDGTWAPIDERLLPAGTDPAAAGWRNAADSVGVRVAPRADAPQLARVSLDAGHAVGFGLAGAKPVRGRVDGGSVTYPSVVPGVDARLDVQGGGVKETLVLASPDAPRSFTFPLSLTGLNAQVTGGQVVLSDAAGQRRATIPAGFMTDSSEDGTTSAGVTYSLVNEDSGPALRVDLDEKWLTDPARKYPVRVDPSVASDGADSSLVVHGSDSHSGSSELLVGRKDGAAAASYVKFAGLADRLRNHTIFGAQMWALNFDAPSCRSRRVSVHPVTQAWSSGSNFNYPGPSVGSSLASKSFAHGYIALGQTRSKCPPGNGTLIELGAGGRKVVQGWADGGANNGLSLRASASDDLGWKRLAGSGTANPPKLFVTHSPYNAKYSIPSPVPNPPVLQNQSGRVKVTVTNLSAETWTPSTYYLAYRAYNANTGKAVVQQRSANLTGNVARGAKVTLDAEIKPLPPGKYFLDFTMVRTGGIVFTDEQVPPARIVLEVTDIPPVVQELFPPNGYPAQTLSPQLWARALDIDAPPGSSLQYKFEICEADAAGNPTGCTTTAYQASPAYTVPAGRLVWNKTYLWRAFVKDATTEVPSPRSALLTDVPQPEITSHLAGAPLADQQRDFDPQTGNVSTSAIDAAPATVGGAQLRLVRTYNSLDPRRDSPFGAGWTTQYDMKLIPDNDGSGNVVISYPDGQQVRFGKNPDGSYAAPSGRIASLTWDGTNYKLLDTAKNAYTFSTTGRLTKISDAANHWVVLTYSNTDGKLAKAQVNNSQSNTAGRALIFTWSGAHVTSVKTDPVNGSALTWTYTYTGDLLTQVCASGSICTGYSYAQGSQYRGAVLDDRPESYWRLGEPSGATGAGSEVAVNLGKDRGTYSNVTLEAPGVVAGSGDTAGSFNGFSSYLDLPKGALKKSRDSAVEVWFKATSTSSGGPLIGYQDKAVGTASTIGVPVLYAGTDGRLHGQFWNGAIAPMVAAGKPVNDNKWHHAVLSSMGATQTLYLDGVQAATTSNSATVDTSKLTVNQVGAAYATTPASWTGWGTTSQQFFNGTIDDVAVYSHPLGQAQVAAHYKYGTTAADQLSSVTLPSGKVAAAAEYTPGTGRAAEYTDSHGGTWKLGAPTVYGSDTDLRRDVEIRDPSNRPYLYEYDALTGRMIRSGAPTGLVIRDEDKTDATPTATPAPSPTTICSSPDPGDLQFCTTIPGESGGPVFEGHNLDGVAIRTYEYDDRGFPNKITNENGDTVSLTYDVRGNVTSRKTCRTATECHTDFYTYPAVTDPVDPRNFLPTEYRDGRSTGATDNRFRTSYNYHSTGQLLTQTNPGGSAIRNTYSVGTEPTSGGLTPTGLLLTASDERSAVTRYGYFHNGDLQKVTDPSGLVTTYTYDALGRTISETETSDAQPSGVTTTYTYDALGHLSSATEPATTDAVTGARHQRKITLTYDVDGNMTSTRESDLLGGDAPRETTYTYDDHNQVASVTDPEGNETSYDYDRFGNPTSVVDANGNRYEYGYTARNMLAEVRLRDWDDDPDGTPDPAPGDALVLNSYAYDFAGRLARELDAMGRRSEYAYYGDDLVKSVTLKGFHNPDGTTRDYVRESNTYDGAGNLTRQVTGNGQTVTDYTVNPVGTVAAEVADTGGLARRTGFTYDAGGNVTKVSTSGFASNVLWFTSSAAEEVGYTYDLAGNRTQQTQTNGSQTLTTSHTYDQRGLLTSTTDPRGNVSGADKAAYTTSFGHDEIGRQSTVTGPAVQAESSGNPAQTVRPSQTIGYNNFGEPTAVKDELDNISSTGYDRLGRPVTEAEPTYTPPGGATITPVTRTSYDGLGNVTEIVDPAGNAARYGYDRLNRLVKQDEPAADNDDRAVWRHAYTRTGQELSVTDPTGARVESTYDDLDRPVTFTEVEREPVADNFTTRYGYDDAGNLTTTTSPTGSVTSSTYDAVGELTKTTDPNGVVTQYGYDFAGRQVRVSDALGRTSRTDFDLFGRRTAESDLKADGTELRDQRYGYDPAGNPTSVTDPLGHTTTYDFDALDRLTRQVEPTSDTHSITTGFGYDAAGNRTRYTDGRGNSTVYTVNTLGLPEQVIEPSTPAHPNLADRTWTTGYNATADPVRLAAPGGVVRNRTYDAAGRLTKETGSGATSATADRTLAYDKAGRPTKASAPGGDDTFVYDDRGDLLSATGPSGTATFGYDGDGNPTLRTDAAGTSRFSYVKARLATVTDGITGTTETLGYDSAGAPKTVDYGAGRVRSLGYDDLGRLTSDQLKNSAGQTAASVAYDYDLNDRLTSKTTTGTAAAGTNTYGHDQAGRLTSWTSGGTTTDYAWDDAGNRTRNGAKTATYDARNRLTSDGDFSYSYTPRGTLASKTSSGLSEQYSFDAFDRLITAAGHTYGYDGLDRLDSRDGQDLSYAGTETDPVSDGATTYARDPAGGLLAAAQGQNKQLALADQHDDQIGGIDPADTTLNALKSSTAYDPFGRSVAKTGTPPGNTGYQSDWTDPATNQVNMGARWYNPATGTFNSRDDWPLNPDPSAAANRYTYANADPLDNTDPTGHMVPCGGNAHLASLGSRPPGGRCAGSAVGSAAARIGAAIARALAGKGGGGGHHHGGGGGGGGARVGGGHADPSAAERAEAARQAALARARAVTAAAKRRAAFAAKHHPVPTPKAARQLDYSGHRTPPVSSSPAVPAKSASPVRDVVADHNKAVQAIYDKAVADAGEVVKEVSDATKQKPSDCTSTPGITSFTLATPALCGLADFVKEHAAAIAGIVTGVVVGAACGAAIGWTGVGAVVCGAVAGAAGAAVQDLVEGGHSPQEILRDAAFGGIFGGLTGGLGAAGGQALRAGARAIGGNGLRGAAEAADSAVGGEIDDVFGGLAGRTCNSFAAGTAVLMSDGSSKSIEAVAVGDKVKATDPTTGKTADRKVTDTITGTGDKHLVAVTIDTDGNKGGKTSTLTATAGHPFWVQNLHRWADAKDLRPGDMLRTAAGTYVQVVKTRQWTAYQRVHNLTIDTTHTYYVSAGEKAVLVHNDGCDGLSSLWPAARNQESIDALSAGEGLSGIFDPATGRIEARLSGDAEGAVLPRRGGHGILNRGMFGDSRSTVGFTAIVQEDGSLQVTWLSRGVTGRNYPASGGIASREQQEQILDALRAATGRRVIG